MLTRDNTILVNKPILRKIDLLGGSEAVEDVDKDRNVPDATREAALHGVGGRLQALVLPPKSTHVLNQLQE